MLVAFLVVTEVPVIIHRMDDFVEDQFNDPLVRKVDQFFEVSVCKSVRV